jgi:predicted regulator of Ras-like GTPase activity (Roadblock/LC7/MglB family)
MTYFWIPVLTFGGALLFFAAGLLAARARRLSPVRPALPVMGELSRLDPEGEDSDLRTQSVSHHDARELHGVDYGARPGVDSASAPENPLDEAEQIALFERVLFAEADARSTRMELEQSSVRIEELQRDLDELSDQLVRVQRQGAAPSKTPLSPLPVARSAAPVSSTAAPSGPPPLPAAAKVAPAEADDALNRERLRTRTLERELMDLQTQLVQTPEADVVAGLRRDLMVANEQARAQQGLVERTANENARQKAALSELTSLRGELTRLRAENRELRALGLVAQKPKRPRAPALARPDGTKSSAQTLQALVDQIAERDEVRAAVVADERGLVVAASGDNSDAIAAVGAVVARAAAQVGRLLPIGTARKVVLHDEHGLTVAFHPLDAEGRKLLLLTVALGETGGPDEESGPSGSASGSSGGAGRGRVISAPTRP